MFYRFATATRQHISASATCWIWTERRFVSKTIQYSAKGQDHSECNMRRRRWRVLSDGRHLLAEVWNFSSSSNWQLIKRFIFPQTTITVWVVWCQRSRVESSYHKCHRWISLMVAEPDSCTRKGIWIRHHRCWFKTGEWQATTFNVIFMLCNINLCYKVASRKVLWRCCSEWRKRFFIDNKINLRWLWQS